MAQLRIYCPIASEEDKVFLSDWFGEDSVSYKDLTSFLDSMEDDDNKIDLLLHCPGGDCVEGWAMYDKLRNSGKEISATIEGECSSMGTILLLAAPKERRFGFENASMCIHNPSVEYPDLGCPDRLTAEAIGEMQSKLVAQQASLMEEQNKILDVYVERTGADRDELQNLMNEDKYVDMARAKELGFITDTIAPNTARKYHNRTKNIKKMAKTKNVTVDGGMLNKLLALCGLKKIEDVAQTFDQTITAADGSELTVEREDGDPQVGDKAYPNGSYTLDDGTVIVVENEVIASITPAGGEGGEGNEGGEGGNGDGNGTGDTKGGENNSSASTAANDEKDAQITALTQQVSDLTSQVESLKAENESLKTENNGLKSEKEDLTKAQKTEDEQAILDKVNKAGGKKWLDTICNMSSTFHASSRVFTPRANNKDDQEMSKTKRLLAEAKARNKAKREGKQG